MFKDLNFLKDRNKSWRRWCKLKARCKNNLDLSHTFFQQQLAPVGHKSIIYLGVILREKKRSTFGLWNGTKLHSIANDTYSNVIEFKILSRPLKYSRRERKKGSKGRNMIIFNLIGWNWWSKHSVTVIQLSGENNSVLCQPGWKYQLETKSIDIVKIHASRTIWTSLDQFCIWVHVNFSLVGFLFGNFPRFSQSCCVLNPTSSWI